MARNVHGQKFRSILIVNSEPDIADLFAEMLLMDVENYMVTTAYTGKDCLLALEKDEHDMVLVDMELPDIDGWELIRKIKELRPRVSVVAISAHPPEIKDFSRLVMIYDYLMKPVTLDGLQIAVKDALEVPFLLEKCIETVSNREIEGKAANTTHSNYILLLKQNIIDRKRYLLMRQLYPDKKLKYNYETKLLLESLREKIDNTSVEIETFKSKECLVSSA